MESKKSNKANLEGSRKSFLLIGSAVATSLVLMAFEWSSVSYKSELATNKIEKPYEIPFTDTEVEILRPEQPKIAKSEKVNNEYIEVTENIPVDSKEEEEESDEKFEIPALDESFKKGEEEYSNFIHEEEGPEKIEPMGPSIKVPFYDYCKDDTYEEKIQCISNEIHKSIGKGLANITSYQIEGCKKSKMYVQFVINKEGHVESLEIAGENDFNKEIVKMVKNSMIAVPQMNPAMKNGKPVSVYFSIPINFNIQ